MGKVYKASKLIDEKFGKKGTKKREEFDEESYAYYFGEIIRNRRKQLKLTQEQVAQRIGKKRPYISRVEGGEDLKLSNLIKITKALGLSFQLSPL